GTRLSVRVLGAALRDACRVVRRFTRARLDRRPRGIVRPPAGYAGMLLQRRDIVPPVRRVVLQPALELVLPGHSATPTSAPAARVDIVSRNCPSVNSARRLSGSIGSARWTMPMAPALVAGPAARSDAVWRARINSSVSVAWTSTS